MEHISPAHNVRNRPTLRPSARGHCQGRGREKGTPAERRCGERMDAGRLGSKVERNESCMQA